jgi:short-subunit dehydrogenase
LVAIAVVAGAGPGLGYSLAKKFSSEYKVVLLSRTQEKLDALANEIKKEGGEVCPSAALLM